MANPEFEAVVERDSISEAGKRLVTVVATYPRMIHAEVMTHRAFARNAASSRAIPFKKMVEMVMVSPFVPRRWGAELKGMQTGDAIVGLEGERLAWKWLGARDEAVKKATSMHEMGLHKSICNRLLEPFSWITTIITATEWANFFRLRCHQDAEVHLQKIACMIRDEMTASVPRLLMREEWHTPFVTRDEAFEMDDSVLCQVATARAARVSYLTHDGTVDVSKDVGLFEKLAGGSGFGHWCYDAETEVLTDNGWMTWPEAVEIQPKLAAVDVHSGEIEFEQPAAWTDAEYDGEMYTVKCKSLDLMVTPEHNMVVCSRKSGNTWTPYSLKSASSIAGRPSRYLRAGHLSTEQRVSVGPRFGFDAEQFAALVGFYIGDGDTPGKDDRNLIRFNLSVPRKVTYLKRLIPSVEEMSGTRMVVRADGIAAWFRENCSDGKDKLIPKVYLTSTRSETAALLDGLKNSDGSVKRRTWTYSSCSRQVIDTLQILLHLNGLSANVKVAKKSLENNKWRDLYRLEISEKISPRIEPGCRTAYTTTSEEWVQYSGKVYCATVSTGALMVRRNGIVCISGNSPHEHVAEPLDDPWARSGPFVGWRQYRKSFEGENAVTGLNYSPDNDYVCPI